MVPFLSLGFPLLPASATKRLSLYILRHPEKASDHISSVAKAYDGLSHHWPALGVVMPEIVRLRSVLTLKFEPMIAYMKPTTDLALHCDGLGGGRQCSLVQAIHPIEDYASTFFLTPDDVQHELSASDLPALMNLQCLHSVNNTSLSPRFNFQLSFNYPFEEVAELQLAGKLFRSALVAL